MGPAEKAWQPVLTAHLVGVPVTLFCAFECATAFAPPAELPRLAPPAVALGPSDACFRTIRGPMLPLVGGVNVLLIVGVVVGVISLISLFLTATSDPGVYLRSEDRGALRAALRHTAIAARSLCPLSAQARRAPRSLPVPFPSADLTAASCVALCHAAITEEADRRDMATGWRFTQGSMDGKLQDLKFCRTNSTHATLSRLPLLIL